MTDFYFLSKQSIPAVEEWLTLLEKYDKEYTKEIIIAYKLKKIQNTTFKDNIEAIQNLDLTHSNFLVHEPIIKNNLLNPDLEELHAMELAFNQESVFKEVSSLSEGMEDLSETLTTFFDDEDDDESFLDLTM